MAYEEIWKLDKGDLGQCRALDLDAFQIGSAVIVRGEPSELRTLTGWRQPLSEYDYLMFFIGWG